MNGSLNTAKAVKNDEFYTLETDIAREVNMYAGHVASKPGPNQFEGKIVYLNCDDSEIAGFDKNDKAVFKSKFFEFFVANFHRLQLKELIGLGYTYDPPSIVNASVVTDDGNGGLRTRTVQLKGDGDFRSAESIAFLKRADIVVTNPPFSLFREYIAQLVRYNKKFLIIGSENAITYKEVFPLLQHNKVWLGYHNVKEFVQPDGTIKKFGNIGWYTNLDTATRHQIIHAGGKYNPTDYPTYDNYDAIEVSKVAKMPMIDNAGTIYPGVMGVPVGYLKRHNPDQFEIIGLDELITAKTGKKTRLYISGNKKYARILIRRK